jgi:hypothetical protein
MRDLLVCYLLGELPEAERAELESRLTSDARLRDELERLRLCLLPDDALSGNHSQPPQSLIARTVRCVSDSQSGDGELKVIDQPASSSGLSLVDGIVAVGVVLAISMLILPALRESRDSSRRTVCQNNLKDLGIAAFAYASDNGGHFPNVGLHQPAGIFAVRLVEGGYLDRTQTMQLICPSSKEAEMLRSGEFGLHIPTLPQVERNCSKLPPYVRLTMGGSFAYRVGYFDGGTYVSIRNRSDSRSPLISDAPNRERIGSASPNHDGQNVLFEDGRVMYVVGYLVPTLDNHIFLNNDGQAAPGVNSMDPVLGRSEMIPGAAIPVDGPQWKITTE